MPYEASSYSTEAPPPHRETSDFPDPRGAGPAALVRDPYGPPIPPPAPRATGAFAGPGGFATYAVLAVAFGVAAFILLTMWLLHAFYAIFGFYTGSLVLAGIYFLGFVWAVVSAKRLADDAGGVPVVLRRLREGRAMRVP